MTQSNQARGWSAPAVAVAAAGLIGGCGSYTDVVAVWVQDQEWTLPPPGADAGVDGPSVLVRARDLPPGWPFEPVAWPLDSLLADAFDPSSNQAVRFRGSDAEALLALSESGSGRGRPVAVRDAAGAVLLLSLRNEQP